jgi:hypothetical protein
MNQLINYFQIQHLNLNFKDAFLYNDTTYMFHIAKSIMTLQSLYGIIPNVYGKGKFSKV